MIVQVTADDINAGKKKNCRFCPVAAALTKIVGLPCIVFFGGGYVFHTPVEYYLPRAVGDWITKFDAGAPVEPFAFEFPDSVLEEVKKLPR